MWSAEQQLKLHRPRRSVVHTFAVGSAQGPIRRDAINYSIVPTDPMWSKQWYLDSHGVGKDISVRSVWEQGLTGKGVVVSIVDDGMEHDHPDLVDNYDPEVGSREFN